MRARPGVDRVRSSTWWALVALVLAVAIAGCGSVPSPTVAIVSRTDTGASATAVRSTTGPWKTLVAFTGAGAAWSPDGAYLAVWSISNSEAIQNMQLLDSRGTLVRSLDADRFVWLDTRGFVLVRGGSAFLGSVASDVLSPVLGSFSGDLLSGYHGAITSLTSDPSNPSNAHFVVWTPQGGSKPVNGQPVAWSPDGTKIAVWRPKPRTASVGIGYQDTGTVDILAWPSLTTLANVPGESFVAQPSSFDPTGRYLLVSRLGLAGSFVFDLATGKNVGPASIGGSNTTGIVWGSEGDLLVASNDGSMATYSIPGTASVGQTGLGDLAESSANGSTVVLAFGQNYSGSPRPITLMRGGSSTTVPVPGGLVADPAISADGSGVVVFCLIDQGRQTEHTEALLLVG